MTTEREPTVEEVVKELHALLPHRWFFVALRVTWPQGSEMASSSAVIEVADGAGGKAEFYDPYLRNCIAAVREWHIAMQVAERVLKGGE